MKKKPSFILKVITDGKVYSHKGENIAFEVHQTDNGEQKLVFKGDSQTDSFSENELTTEVFKVYDNGEHGSSELSLGLVATIKELPPVQKTIWD